jgi:Transposase DDE domain
MNIPLIPDLSNPKWLIIQQILKTIGSKRSQKIASRLKIQDISIFIDCIKILVLADTFEKDYSYVISEINSNISLKRFISLGNIPEVDYFYKFISKLENNQLNTYFRNIFTISSNTHEKGRRYVIIDTTSIPVDINTWRKRFKIGKNKRYKWSHSSSEGFYVGYKVILAIDALTFEVLGFEIFEGSPNDAKLLEKFINKLSKSRKVRMGDFIMCDRGFTSMKNYHILISRFLLVPMIFARKNTDVKRILSTLTPPISIWDGKSYLLDIWKKIVKEFVEILEIWPVFRELRSNIELFFNVAKNCVRLNKVHQFTKESVGKKVIRAFHLTSELIGTSKLFNIGVRELAEM